MVKQASGHEVRKYEQHEKGNSWLLTGIGAGLLCIIVGIVAICGLEECRSLRPSRQGMAVILRFLGNLLGETGGWIFISIGAVVFIASVVAFIHSRVKKC